MIWLFSTILAIIMDVTGHEQTAEALPNTIERHTSILKAALDGFLLTDMQGRLLEVNHSYHKMSGYDQAELRSMNLADLEGVKERDGTLARIQEIIAQGSDIFESRHRRKGGDTYPVEISIQHRPEQEGYLVIFIRDISERKRMEEALRRTQYSIDKIADIVIWLDENGKYVFVNDAATKALGYSKDELYAMYIYDVDPLFDKAKWDVHWQEIETRGTFTIETINRSRDGRDIPVAATVNYVEFDGQKYNCAIVRDITERRNAEAELTEINRRILLLSITDGLTGIANRRHFDDILKREYARHSRSGAKLSLIILDIDAFKSFNDLYGHLKGDECLRLVGGVLADNMRRPEDLASRYGGEEFVCVLPNTDQSGAMVIAERIRHGIMELGIRHARSQAPDIVTASLGVVTALCSKKGSPEDIVALADTLLYRAKASGRNRTVCGELVV